MHKTVIHKPSEPVPDTPANARRREIIPLCTHVFPPTPAAPARTCAAVALRGQRFCYFHHPTRKRVANPNERRARRIARQAFDVPLPGNRIELQLALNEVILRLAANQLDVRRAGLLLFALQTVGQTIPAPPRTPPSRPAFKQLPDQNRVYYNAQTARKELKP